MTFDSMSELARDYYGAELTNAYTDKESPSDIARALIDNGNYVIALVKLSLDGLVTEYGSISHFILINGYTEYDGVTEFIYANSYNSSSGGISLDHLPETLLDHAVSADYYEPNTLAYAELSNADR